MIQQWLAIIESYFIGHTASKAIAVGLITSWCVTQGWKYHPAIAGKSDDKAKVITRAVAFIFGFLPTLILWPLPGLERWPIAFMVGVASPMAATILLRVTRRWAPWLDPSTSTDKKDPAC